MEYVPAKLTPALVASWHKYLAPELLSALRNPLTKEMADVIKAEVESQLPNEWKFGVKKWWSAKHRTIFVLKPRKIAC